MTDPIQKALETCLASELLLTNKKILVAYSGGLDSSVLLHALSELRNSDSKKLAQLKNTLIDVIHIDHQLQEASLQWSDFCKTQCENYGFTFKSVKVSIDTQSSQSIEAMAREARYAEFHKLMDANSLLFTAQHANDQVETFMLQLFRGAGPKGLSAMATGRNLKIGKHLRPLLNLSRGQLEEYASENKVTYIEDPSNFSDDFDRNYLRNNIIPQITSRYPGMQKAIVRSVSHIASEHRVLDGFLSKQLNELREEDYLYLPEWKKIANEQQALLLRKWLSEMDVQMPSTKILDNILFQLQHAHGESKTCISWATVELRTYQDKIFSLKQVDEESYRDIAGTKLQSEQVLTLDSDYGDISFETGSANSLSLRLEFRSGGEKLRLVGHKHHLSLKQLFQKKRVVPWMRSRIPLLFDHELLVAVGDMWLNADWLEQHKSPNFSVQWHNKPRIFA